MEVENDTLPFEKLPDTFLKSWTYIYQMTKKFIFQVSAQERWKDLYPNVC